jgi:hypothetical protein
MHRSLRLLRAANRHTRCLDVNRSALLSPPLKAHVSPLTFCVHVHLIAGRGSKAADVILSPAAVILVVNDLERHIAGRQPFQCQKNEIEALGRVKPFKGPPLPPLA